MSQIDPRANLEAVVDALDAFNDKSPTALLPKPISRLGLRSAPDFPRTKSVKTVSSSSSSIIDLEVGPASSDKGTRSFAYLCFAHLGLGLTLFLATTDTTIVSTSLPTIVDSFGTSASQYSLPGVAYLLPQTALQPLFPRFSDVLGRKRILFSSICVFLVASTLCGFAQNMTWLVLGRAMQGVGSGGIVSSVWVLTSEIVPMKDRSKWSQALSLTWSSSAVAGPLIGGLFSGSSNALLSWRWGFFINVPIGFVGSAILVLCLPPLARKSCPEFVLKRLADPRVSLSKMDIWVLVWRFFDFAGLFLLVGGSTCVIVGFYLAGSIGWSAPSTCSVLALGFVLLVIAGYYEAYTTRDALIPPKLFRMKTTVAVLTISFLHNIAFTNGTFFLALYYQAVHGTSPLMAGVRSLPYSLGSALASMPTAWYISWAPSDINRRRKEVMLTGLAISSIGFGCMVLLNEHTPLAAQEVIPLIAGIGVGMLFHTPFGLLSECLPAEDLASVTGAFFLVRFIGSTTGLSIANAIFSSTLKHNLPLNGTDLRDYSGQALRGLIDIQDPAARAQVLKAVSEGIQRIWIFCTPCLVIGCLASTLISPSNSACREPMDSDRTGTEGKETDTDTDTNTTTNNGETKQRNGVME